MMTRYLAAVIKGILLLAVLLVPEREAWAIPFRFIHYGIEDKMPSSTVWSIAQDGDGFLWFGTDNGLCRFDGYLFKTYQHTPGDSTSLADNYIYAQKVDRRGRHWIGSSAGVSLYDAERECFRPFRKRTIEGHAITSTVVHIIEDSRGNLWFATRQQGAFRYDPVEDHLQQYSALPGPAGPLLSNSISYLFEDSRGHVWLIHNHFNSRFNYYDPVSKQVKMYTFDFRDVPGAPEANSISIHCMLEDDAGNLWIGTWNNGLCRLNPENGQAELFLSPHDGQGAVHIHSLLLYTPDILLAGSDNGMHAFNLRTHEAQFITSTEFKDNSLSSQFVYPLFLDKEGGLWIGTYYGGINYASPRRGMFEGYQHSKYRNSVAGNIISCFAEDKEGNIWIGTDDGGVSRFNPRTHHFTNYLPEKGKNSLAYHNIHAFLAEGDRLWIGTYTAGLDRLDLRTGHFTHYDASRKKRDAIADNSVYALCRDSRGELWIGSMTGIYRYDETIDGFQLQKEVEATIVRILEDRRGRLWFASQGNGLYRYEQTEGHWSHFRQTRNRPGTLPTNQILSLETDAEGNLWIGTDRGLLRWDDTRECFLAIPLQTPSNVISSITAEGDRLWLGTLNGLVLYHPKALSQRIFYRNDGLQDDQFNGGSLLASDGKLYFGTVNGFNVIDPETLVSNSCIPPVRLTGLQVFNREVPIDPKGILPRSITKATRIDLSYRENVVSIEYAALSFCVPGKNQYKYKLAGFDREWNLVGNQRKATYTNLPAGRYTFYVTGSNNDGTWNEAGASLEIVVHPPFWRTPFAYFLYVACIAGLFFYLLRFSKRRTEERHREKIRELRAEKDREIQAAKINFFTLIAHEIRTPVSLIIGPLEKIMGEITTLPPAMQSDLKVINRNSCRLLHLVNQLLDFRKAEQGLFVVRFTRQDTGELIRNAYDRFKPLVEQKGISFELLPAPGSDMQADVDGEAVTKIISNLLTNASKYARSRIEVRYAADMHRITFSVTDDGCGISPEEQQRIFQPFYQTAGSHKPGTGIGLSLVKLLVDAHHGMIDVESRLGAYSTFTVTLPKTQPGTAPAETQKSDLPLLPEREPAEEATTDRETPAEKEEKASEKRPRLLIVEDNADMRDFLRGSFAGQYETCTATNGEEGLARLKEQGADLIISDVMMPVMDGIAFCHAVKSDILFSHIPFLLLTAKTDADSKVNGIRSGADAYVEKPFSLRVLKAQIGNLLESRKALRKKYSESPFSPIGSIAGNQQDERFLTRIKDIVEKNASNPEFNIDKLAEQLNISRSGLFAKIKTLAGMTPNELIQVVRLKKAAELLTEEKYRINEICYLVGFNNPSYFSKCFQKQFGVSPKDFMSTKH